ncbi:hypothetical protein GCK32_005388 [Trichostrongylus colubriformis]|uniref:SCP domain-containing protein n=1 Tax=Trichostrongylus colubriformis TaxID=6319 RepID=A0AAN8J3C1_TRICO
MTSRTLLLLLQAVLYLKTLPTTAQPPGTGGVPGAPPGTGGVPGAPPGTGGVPAINRMCPDNQGMNDRIRSKAIEAHNFRRMQLARGAVLNKKGRNLPQASNMRKLSIKTWWRQVRVSGGVGRRVTYTSLNVGTPSEWFIRMAWASTQSFGCGVARCGGFWFVVCHYRPGSTGCPTMTSRTPVLLLLVVLLLLTPPIRAQPGSAGQPPAGPPAAGQPPAGPPAAGQPPAGPPAAGQPPAGPPAAGQPPAGPPAAGQPPAGPPAAGQPPAGPPAAGQPPAGPPAAGQPPAGPPAAGQPPAGPPAAGPPAAGQPPAGPPAAGQPPAGPPAAGQPPAAPPAAGQPPAAPPAAGQPPAAPPAAGQPPAGPPAAGKPPVAPPAAGQPSPDTTPPTTPSPVPTGSTVNPAINRMCPDNQDMNDRIRSKALDAHDFRRRQLARGAVVNKRGRNLPQASNMRKLKYDCKLEKSAVAAAATCSIGAQRTLPSDMQENAHFLLRSTAQWRKDAIVEAIKVWWSQVRVSGGIGRGVTYTSRNVNTPTEWFIRMAWADTQSFGCGVVRCGGFWSIVCHYRPGATVNQRIYEPGFPCSACPSGTTCSDGLLCAG